jgi:hypothetical protein
MADTHGFDVIAELTQPALLEMLQQAWVSNTFVPKNIEIGPQNLDGQHILGGQAQIPQSGLGVQLVPNNTLKLQFDAQIQVQMDPLSSPIPLIKIDAHVEVPVPVGNLPGQKDVALLFGSLPAADPNSVTFVGGDPIQPHLQEYITEFVHKLYQEGPPAFPHKITQTNQSFSFFGIQAYTYDADLELLDDPSDSTHQITVSVSGTPPNQILEISIPIHLKLYNIVVTNSLAPALAAPMGIEASLVLTTGLTVIPGSVSADLPHATPTIHNLVPAGNFYGNEGPNYIANRTKLSAFVNLDDTLKTALENQANTSFVANLKPVQFNFPTPAAIQQFIADQIHQTLTAMGSQEIWPGTPANVPSQLQLNDVASIVPPDASVLAIAINADPAGSQIDQVRSFVPMTKLFAIAISGKKTMEIINKAKADAFPNLPVTLHNVNGHDVKLNSLTPSLTNAIHFSGEVTVINAILGKIDVDAGFDVDVGLHWEPPGTDGKQLPKADPGTPDIHLSGLAWLLTILIGFITGGVVGVIVGIVILVVVKNIASSIGGKLVTSTVDQTITGIGAWPSPLDAIGDVHSTFDRAIVIGPDGLLFTG